MPSLAARTALAALAAIALAAAAARAQTLSPVSFGASPSRVVPGAALQLQGVVSPALDSAALRLRRFAFTGDATFWGQMDLLPLSAGSLVFGPAPGTRAPLVPGLHKLSWRSVHQGNAVEYDVSFSVEVTCSDGNPCNGAEVLIDGQCRPAARQLCDDLEPCTIDHCSADGICSHTRDPAYSEEKCPLCKPENCRPNCRGKVCGGDGCGGSCGSCNGTLSCVEGQCDQVSAQGTCNTPFDLTSTLAAMNWNGVTTVEGDTRGGVNLVQPYCNSASAATEKVYMIHNTFGDFVGLDARVVGADGNTNGLDTVLMIAEVNPNYAPSVFQGCIDSNTNPTLSVACTDDSSPPGNLASRVTWVMKPGYYYFVIVDGYSAAQVGPFKLTLTLANTGCTLKCTGKYCGSANCQDFTCGDCAPGFTCSTATFQCVPFPCQPDCSNGRKCGDDGCGGTCGTCRTGESCITSIGKCRKVEACNHLVPLCRNGVRGSFGCPANQYCGSDCACHKIDEPLMDLVIDAQAIQPVIVDNYIVDESSCAIAEQCIAAAGVRRIVKFSTNVVNQGRGAFAPPNPPASFPNLYEWGNCHGHWHFSGFADFELRTPSGDVVVTGRKQSYCAEDSYRFHSGPRVNCFATTDCETQGLSVGWVDVYGPDLDCQFLDITGIPSGQYVIRQCTNQLRTFQELSFENNCVQVPFVIP